MKSVMITKRYSESVIQRQAIQWPKNKTKNKTTTLLKQLQYIRQLMIVKILHRKLT